MTLFRFFPALLGLLLALPAAAAVEVREVTSPGGITAWLVEEPDLPFLALEVRFKGGTSTDLPSKRGAINLMAATLEEGAGELDAQGFAEAREALAARFGFSAGRDSISVSARMLTENRDAAIELLRSALIEPRFDEAAVERVRGQVLSGLVAETTDPGSIARRTFEAIAHPDHPYGSAGDGTPESVAALTRDDLIEAHRAVMTRDRMYVSVVGDITEAEVGSMLDRLLGDLPDIGRQMPGRAEWQAEGGVTVVPFDAPQSVVLFGQAGIRRDDPDFFPAFVLNEVLGGGRFSARLMTELREKRGLTYGVSTSLLQMDLGERIVGQFSTANASAAEAIALVRDDWARLATEGITEAELATTKTYLTGAYPLRFDGNAAIADILVGMQLDGLPPGYIATRNALVEAVTLQDVQRAASRLLQADALRFVVVGQPEALSSTE